MKPIKVVSISYEDAAEHCARTHRHLPKAPPKLQIRACFGIYWKGVLRATAMLGNPVSPWLCREYLEVRRLASDGLYGACTLLYAACLEETLKRGKIMLTYTFSTEPGTTLRLAGAESLGETKTGKDMRKGRENKTFGQTKQKWVWPSKQLKPGSA